MAWVVFTFTLTNYLHKLTILYFSVSFIYSSATSIVVTLIDPPLTETSLEASSLLSVFFISVLFASVCETLLYQFLLIEPLYRMKLSTSVVLFVPSIIFAVSMHH